jgi:hypothetical protein
MELKMNFIKILFICLLIVTKIEGLDNPNTISIKEMNKKLLKASKEINKKITKSWIPPLGIPKKTKTSLELEINKKGLIKQFKVTKKSNIPIFDLSITKAVNKIKDEKIVLSKNINRKKISIDFVM